MASQWVVFGSLTMIAIAIFILFVCTNLFWEFWEELDEEDIKDLERYRRDDEPN